MKSLARLVATAPVVVLVALAVVLAGSLAVLRKLAPWIVLAAALWYLAGGSAARGQDPRRETHTAAPEYRGTSAHASIPAHFHARNVGGSDGAGLCVICSLLINGRSQGVPGVEDLWRVAQTRPGGYSPTKLQALLDEVMPSEKWASYVGRDPAVLERLSRMGYPVGSTMNTGELYGFRPIHHMVSLGHFDRDQDLAMVVDNNRPGVYSWMSSREYMRRWIDGNTGWAFVWLRRARGPAGELVALVAVGSTLAALAVRRARTAGPDHPEAEHGEEFPDDEIQH